MSITKDQIIDAVSSMSITDIMELISAMEKKFNVSIASINTENSITGTNKISETIEEKTEFNVLLKSIGTNKISVIKAVRSVTNLGLKEAKDLVESVPIILKEKVSKNDAESLKKVLEETGAEVEIK